MGGEVASLAAEMTPYVSAAVGAYGGAVLAKVRDDAADATVGLGRRLLQRVFGSHRDGDSPPEPLAALIADPDDRDALAAVRLAIRQAMTDDPALQAELRSMLASASVTQHAHAGRDAYTAGRDQTVINEPDQALAQEYLFMIYEFLRLVVQHEVAKDWVATTADLPRDVPATLRAMQVAQDQADELHDRLAGRVRAVLAGLPDLPATERQSTGEKAAAHFAQLLRQHEGLEES